MKILRSEAVDKSLGVFFDAEFDFNGAGTPGAIKWAKKLIFWKIRKIDDDDDEVGTICRPLKCLVILR